MSDSAPTTRRRFQFCLSELFCVTLLVAIWAWGMRIIGGFYEPVVGWVLLTGTCAIGIWMFVRAAVRHQPRNPTRLPPWRRGNAPLGNGRIDGERLAHDVELLVTQLTELEAEYQRKREGLVRQFAKFGGKPPEPTPKSA
jgi:hypothetical protein